MTSQITHLTFYDSNAHEFIEQTINVDMHLLYQPFISSLSVVPPNHQNILDLGCGSGRDSLYFASLGFNVTAIDASAILIELAKSNHQSDINWQCTTFKDLVQQNNQGQFNGIWACASLLHVSFKELPALLNSMLAMLAYKGILYASFKYGNGERLTKNRFFCDMNETRWNTLKRELNEDVKDTIWITKDQRTEKDVQWFNIMLKS